MQLFYRKGADYKLSCTSRIHVRSQATQYLIRKLHSMSNEQFANTLLHVLYLHVVLHVVYLQLTAVHSCTIL